MRAGEVSACAIEKRCIRKDGAVVWVNLTVGLVRQAGGRPELLVSVVEHIQARKQAERAPAESETRLQLFVEHGPAALARRPTPPTPRRAIS